MREKLQRKRTRAMLSQRNRAMQRVFSLTADDFDRYFTFSVTDIPR